MTNIETIPAPKAKIESGGKIQAIVPQDLDQAFRLAEAIYVSGMYPDSYAADASGVSGSKMGPIDARRTASRIMIGIQKAMEIGLAPITGLSTIYIVNNRPTVFGDGVPALLYGSGKVEYIKEWNTGDFGKDDFTAHCEIKRKDSDEPILRSFSWGDAKTAKLIGKFGPWTTHPKRQLQMRARGFAARDGAADILSGLGIYEEVMDIPEKKPELDTSSLDDPIQMTATEVKSLEQIQSVAVSEKLKMRNDEYLQPLVEKTLEILKENQPTLNEMTASLCNVCDGTGMVAFEESDEHGEIVEGKEPCPNCQR